MEMEQNEFGPKPVLACPLPVFGVTAFATKWGSSASHKSPCRRTARDERVSLKCPRADVPARRRIQQLFPASVGKGNAFLLVPRSNTITR